MSTLELQLPDSMIQPRRRRRLAVLPWLCIALGVALRVARYSRNPSLWLDEGMLALNLASRSFGQLLRPLDYQQGAPVGFLMLEKLAVTFLGTGELALRLVPLLAGIVSVFLFYVVARRSLGFFTSLFGLAVFACAEPLIDYACQVKQYSTDVAWALLILWLAMRASDEAPPPRWRLFRWTVLAVTGAIGMWFSHPAVFVFGGSCAALMLAGGMRRTALVVGVVGALSFVLNYLLFTRTLAADTGLLSVWSDEFAPLPTSLPKLLWYAQTALRLPKDIFGNPALVPDLGHILAGLGVVLIAAGAVLLWRLNRRLLAMLALPVAFALGASLLHKYPFRGRLMLFAVPLLILTMSAGLEYAL